MGRDSSDSESDSSSSSSSSRSRSRENKKRKRDKKEKKKSSKKLKTEKKSKKDKKEKKDKRSKKDGKKDKEDSVTARLRKSMLEALYPEKVGGKTALSDEEKKTMMLEKNKDKLYKKVNLKDRTGMLDKASAVMKGAKGPMSADQAKAYDIHMDQMKGGHGGGNRAPTTY